MPVDHQ